MTRKEKSQGGHGGAADHVEISAKQMRAAPLSLSLSLSLFYRLVTEFFFGGVDVVAVDVVVVVVVVLQRSLWRRYRVCYRVSFWRRLRRFFFC